MSLRSARRDDERGAILVMSALFLVVMVVACALAIDLGQQAKDKRDDHKIADLVSLDAVRALDDINGGCTDAQQQTYVESKAHDAAVRNGLTRAAQTLRHLDWFEVTEIRGQILDGQIEHVQVGMKVGFRLEDS